MQSELPGKKGDRRHNEDKGKETKSRNLMGTVLRGLKRHCNNICTKS